MIPAQQGFHPGDPSRADLNLGLVVKLEFVALNRAAQLIGDDHALGHLAVAFGTVKTSTVTPIGLGAIERQIGLDYHGVGSGNVRRVTRYTDTGRDMNVITFDGIGLGNDLANFGGQPAHRRKIFGIALQDGEFIPAETRHDVITANSALHAGCNLVQKFVAGGVAERVVDVLEMIEIEIKYGKRPGAATACRKSSAESFHKSPAVDEPSQRVHCASSDTF
jgi:hypothetical protein